MKALLQGAACLCLLSLLFAAGAQATTPPNARACPSVGIVEAALGQKFKSPTSTKTVYSKACMDAGPGIVPLKIEFQMDTASRFAASEKAVSPSEIVVGRGRGLGQAARATNGPGELEVLDGRETIKILGLLLPTPKLEALARKLL
jgi:hypothetical protein